MPRTASLAHCARVAQAAKRFKVFSLVHAAHALPVPTLRHRSTQAIVLAAPCLVLALTVTADAHAPIFERIEAELCLKSGLVLSRIVLEMLHPTDRLKKRKKAAGPEGAAAFSVSHRPASRGSRSPVDALLRRCTKPRCTRNGHADRSTSDRSRPGSTCRWSWRAAACGRRCSSRPGARSGS